MNITMGFHLKILRLHLYFEKEIGCIGILPDYEILCEEVKRPGYVGAVKKYGVSDHAIRKWKRHYKSQFEN